MLLVPLSSLSRIHALQAPKSSCMYRGLPSDASVTNSYFAAHADLIPAVRGKLGPVDARLDGDTLRILAVFVCLRRQQLGNAAKTAEAQSS